MKKLFFKFFNIIFSIIIYLLLSFWILNNYNTSVKSAFFINLTIFFILVLFGSLFSKIIFNIRFKQKLKIETISLEKLNKNIIISILFLFIYFSIAYIFIYYFGTKIFPIFTKYSGIINSCNFISKIFLLSVPLYSFEITYFEYCNFVKSNMFHLLFIKLFIWTIVTLILIHFLKLNGLLYSKLIINIIFLPYYVLNLRKIIKLTKKDFA